MKRSLFNILLLVLLAVLGSCIREETPEEAPAVVNLEDEPEYPSEGQAVINFSLRLPGGIRTKAMADKPNITSVRVLIFGSSGYLKESLNAETFESAQVNGDGDNHDVYYNFTIHPSLSDSKNLRVHVVANFDKIVPWDYEETVMNHEAYTTGTDEAYWIRFILPNGITLKKTYNSTTQRMEYQSITVGNKKYFLVTDDVTAKFSKLPLIRNFAKITVESTTPQLVLDPDATMAIINTPDRGSVAPYNTDSLNFVTDYDTLSYDHVKAIYKGFSPQGMQFTNTSPNDVPFVTCTKDSQTGEILGGAYMYERPRPTGGTDAPSYLIVYGTYYPLSEGRTKTDLANHLADPTHYSNPLDMDHPKDGYYKIDFSDSDGYYAILRNFRYHIRITDVSKAGATTPAGAGATGGTGDLASLADVAALTDYSDGYGRIAVSFTEMTFVDPQEDIELKYKFIPDIDEGDEHINNYLTTETVSGKAGPVTITLNAPNPGNQVISSTLDSSIPAGGTDITTDNGKVRVSSQVQDTEGYRTIHLTVNEPTANRSEQIITISGMVDESAHQSISRDIKLILMARQYMTVTCEADEPSIYYPSNYVEGTAGQGLNVKINIPIGLPESMFPLVFDVESDKLSLTPNTAKYPDANLPVESGTSICDGQSGKSSFRYKKTVSYEQYKAIAQNSDNTKTIVCNFKTNKAESEGKVYVDNHYFYKANAEFKNYTMYSFREISFSSYSPTNSANFECYLYLDKNDPKGTSSNNNRKILITLVGCNPQGIGSNTGWAQVQGYTDMYTYDVTNVTAANQKVTLKLKALASYPNGNTFFKVTMTAFDTVDGNNVQVYHETAIANKPQNFYVTPDEVDMHVGESKLLTATLVPEYSQYTDVTWSSSNTSVATVTDGRVYAVGMGEATITASITNTSITATCAVTVSAVSVTGVVLDKSYIRLGVDKTYTLHHTVTPSNATDKAVTWASDTPGVATVNQNGVVTGITLGTALITVTTHDGNKIAQCTVDVVPTPVESVSLDKATMSLRPGRSGTLTATILPANAANKDVTWSSSNPSIVTVTPTGTNANTATATITAGSNTGTATITVTTADGGYTATCTVTVRNSYFTVNLDAGGNDNTYGYPWVTMGSSLQNGGTVITCPDGYYGYQSDVYNKNSKLATMSVTIVGYTEFDIYIRSNAESSYDYVIIKTTIASSISTSGAIANTSGNQQSGTNISDYTKVTLTTGNGLTDDTTAHTFYIQYGKDSSVQSGTDSGYVLIPKEYYLEE